MFKEIIKTIAANIIIHALGVFSVFPINKQKVLFVPMNGHYYCNLKYIDLEARKENMPIHSIWVTKNLQDTSYPVEIKKCRKCSVRFLFHFFTSRVVLFNDALPSWLFKRRGQTFINTWHGGGAYKKIDAVYKNMPKWRKLRAAHIWNSADYVISSCLAFSKVFRQDTGIAARYLPIGMPRNDIFFDNKLVNEISGRVRSLYNIESEMGIVLYAPTFRDNGMALDLGVEDLLQALQTRFQKKFILLVRSHPHIARDIFAKVKHPNDVIDVSNYADMQELLAAADVLVTDYSSCMWDFSFTGRPCFIYANDLSSYKKERNFHTPIDQWPFPLAERNEELIQNILRFDQQKYDCAVRLHHEKLGSYETGHASVDVCHLLNEILERDKRKVDEQIGGGKLLVNVCPQIFVVRRYFLSGTTQFDCAA